LLAADATATTTTTTTELRNQPANEMPMPVIPTKYRFPILMSSIIATFFTGYQFKEYFLGDIEKDRKELWHATDVEGHKQISDSIVEARKEYFRKMFSDKK